MKKLLRYRHKTTSDLKQEKSCKKCLQVKPRRAHHCSVCNECVLVMDHHCPWINNCVGFENKRYFLLFCFYLMGGCCYMLTTLHSLKHIQLLVASEYKPLFTFCRTLDSVLAVVLMVFCLAHGYLALSG